MVLLLQLFAGQIFGTTKYVSLTGSNTFPYTSLATAANTIQTAVSACSNGDIILVDDGTYLLSTLIDLGTKGITVRSINGSAVTIVDGNNATKCFEIDNVNAVIDGFTIQNGKNLGGFGGGVNIQNGGTVQNCLIKNNQARDGGGVALDYGGLVINCVVTGNTSQYGGGIRCLSPGTKVKNCLVVNNTSTYLGGGVNTWDGGDIYNCTIVRNTAPVGNGSGIRTRNAGHVYNSIIVDNYNTSGNLENWNVNGSGYTYNNVCTTPLAPNGTNNITANPNFVNTTPGSEDYHLQATSPCIDAGLNFGWMSSITDLDGNTRIVNVIVDMGPYEHFTPAPLDADGDGVPDGDDDYPLDPARAFNNYYPASGYGTLAFEDLWPAKGDYDFNDLVCDYRFKTVTNASNKVVEVFSTFIIKAFGAGMHNGFGFQFPTDQVLQSQLTVTGYNIATGSYITLGANGLEAGQVKPTIIVYDDAYRLMQNPGYGIGVNTDPNAPYVTPDTVVVHIAFAPNTYTIPQVGIDQFNPFIIVSKNRDKEVHLPNYPPTSLADQSLFGQADDTSDPGIGRYYKTSNNLPWAINIYESFDYPIERVVITSAYNHFVDWAESGGTLFPDWYQDNSGYRNDSRIY